MKKTGPFVVDRVLLFAMSREGTTFYMRELVTYVRLRFPNVAPGTPERVLRTLRENRLIDYTLLNRAASYYRMEGE